MKRLATFIIVLWCISMSYAQNLWDLSIRFCNDEKIVWWSKMLLTSWDVAQRIPICIIMTNSSSLPLKFGINFVDGSITADAEQRKACLPETEKNNFGQYITSDSTWFYITWKASLKTIAYATFPKWYAGLSNWCLTAYMIDNNTSTGNKMFTVFSRLWYFIDILVNGEYRLDLTLSGAQAPFENFGNNQIPLYRNTITRTTQALYYVVNTWNIPLDVQITTTTSRLWDTTSHTYTQKSLPQQATKVEDNVWPWWYRWIGWPVTYTIDTVSKATQIGPVLPTKETKTISVSVSYFFFPRWIVGIIILFIYWRWKKSR